MIFIHFLTVASFVFLLTFPSQLRADESKGVFLSWQTDEMKIEQVGEAPADAPDRERIAKRNAIVEAVRAVVGEEIKSRTMVADLSLVYDKVFTKMSGYVKKVHPIGIEKISDGIFYQSFSIIVVPPALDKTLLESSIEAQIDIPVIYEMIESPRIAMAITETVIDKSGNRHTRDPDMHSESKIQEFFKQKNPNFYFISLPSLTYSMNDKPDWISLGKKNNFDVIITGEVLTSYLLKVHKKVRGIGKNINIPMYRYSSELTWNIINLSRAERENTVHAIFDKGDVGNASSEVAAKKYAKDQVLKAAIPKLFNDLMLTWVQTVYYTAYEITFDNTKAHFDQDIARTMRGIPCIVPESIHSRGSINGNLTYNLRVQGTLGEISNSLVNFFPDYSITENRVGKILFSPVGTKKNIFQLKVQNCSFTQSEDFGEILRSMNGIWQVSEPTLSDGIALYTITSSAKLRDVAIQIEKKMPVLITTMNQNFIQARTK